MKKYICLLRGINVGGRRIIKMADLKNVFVELDCKNIETYIQSGNLTFNHQEANEDILASLISEAISNKIGFDVSVFIINKGALNNLINNCPFEMNVYNIDKIYFTFFNKIPSSTDFEILRQEFNNQSDKFYLKEKTFYLLCTNGYGKTKLSNPFIEKKLKVVATTRNLKTMLTLQKMVNG